jgi:hypothetical protein
MRVYSWSQSPDLHPKGATAVRNRNGESLIPLTRIRKNLRSDGDILDGRGTSADIGWDSANRCIHLFDDTLPG